MQEAKERTASQEAKQAIARDVERGQTLESKPVVVASTMAKKETVVAYWDPELYHSGILWPVMSFWSLIRRPPSYIVEHRVSNGRGAVAVACGSAPVDRFHADFHAIRKSRSSVGWSADDNQPRITGVVPSQPYRYDWRCYCVVPG